MTSLRQAQPDDQVALDNFFVQHPETSMFLRGNLAAHGLNNTAHRHGTTYWLEEHGDITGIIGCTNGGYLMCQAPNAAASFWDAAAQVLSGHDINGLTGVPAQVNAWIVALSLNHNAFSIKVTEPLYHLSLADLVTPVMSGLAMRKPRHQDAAILVRWFEGYAHDTGITSTDGPLSAQAAAVFIDHSAARILVRDGVAVAMNSLNSEVSDTVQIDCVYVRPELRGQGLGSRVVAAQLSELRAKGKTLAILFAANAPDVRAYERIGFRHVGSYEIAMLKFPNSIRRHS